VSLLLQRPPRLEIPSGVHRLDLCNLQVVQAGQRCRFVRQPRRSSSLDFCSRPEFVKAKTTWRPSRLALSRPLSGWLTRQLPGARPATAAATGTSPTPSALRLDERSRPSAAPAVAPFRSSPTGQGPTPRCRTRGSAGIPSPSVSALGFWGWCSSTRSIPGIRRSKLKMAISTSVQIGGHGCGQMAPGRIHAYA
jgi:hypothetical protein